MLTLFYAPGACSLASHIVLEESGEKYEGKRVNLAAGEQRTEAFLKINPQGRVPALQLDNGEFLSENTAILPYLGKRFGMWPTDPIQEARALSLIGFLAASVHPAHAHTGRPERYADDVAVHPALKAKGRETFLGYLKLIDQRLAGREWMLDSYTPVDPYALVMYSWGPRHQFDVTELKNYTAFKDRMVARPAVQRALADENIKL